MKNSMHFRDLAALCDAAGEAMKARNRWTRPQPRWMASTRPRFRARISTK